ncbi:MAG: hypothetical protein GX606_03140 [Elusimicrobia bacterium]|nr:hypothetical protein [Elusimicrobiota bacterium]
MRQVFFLSAIGLLFSISLQAQETSSPEIYARGVRYDSVEAYRRGEARPLDIVDADPALYARDEEGPRGPSIAGVTPDLSELMGRFQSGESQGPVPGGSGKDLRHLLGETRDPVLVIIGDGKARVHVLEQKERPEAGTFSTSDQRGGGEGFNP